MSVRLSVWGEVVEAGRAVSVPARRFLGAHALLWVGRGIQSVLFNLAWSVGWSTSTAGAGVLIERAGFAGPLLLAAGVCAASSLVLVPVFRGQPRRRPVTPLSPTDLDPR